MARWWALYYWAGPGEDFSIVTSDDCAPEDVPLAGAVAVLQADSHTGTEILDTGGQGESKYFVFREDHDQWYKSDEAGWITNHMPNIHQVRAMRCGWFIPNEDYARLLTQQNRDRSPRKSSFWHGERRA